MGLEREFGLHCDLRLPGSEHVSVLSFPGNCGTNPPNRSDGRLHWFICPGNAY